MQIKHWFFLVFVVVFLLVGVRYISGCGHTVQPVNPDAPQILSVSPAGGAGGVGISIEVSAIFDKDMQASSINSSTFTLTSESGQVTGSVNYDPASKTAKFAPASILAYSTTYSASISASVIDIDSISLESPYGWSFTTTGLSGSLDLSFGTNGVAVYGGNYDQSDRGKGVAADNTDRVLVSAQIESVGGQAALLAYKENGVLDPTFGSNGAVIIKQFFPEKVIFDQQHNRILTTGWNSSMLLKAFDQNGAPDTSFNGTGSVSSLGPAGIDAAGYGLAIDQNGKIVVAGSTATAQYHSALGVWRYLANGQPDTSFNGSGVIVHDLVQNTDFFFVTIRGMGIDPSGRIIALGGVTDSSYTFSNVVWCVKPDGSLDASFGDGTHTGYIQDEDGMMVALALDSSGKILVTGLSESGDMQIRRYNSDGSFDPAFGSGGSVTHTAPDIGKATYGAKGRAIAVDQAGRIMVAGNVETSNTPPFIEEMIVWRCNPDGSLDTTFANQGWLHTSGSAGATTNKLDEPSAVMIDRKGRIVITGTSNNASGNGDVTTWRIN